jgi:hypothetical protein
VYFVFIYRETAPRVFVRTSTEIVLKSEALFHLSGPSHLILLYTASDDRHVCVYDTVSGTLISIFFYIFPVRYSSALTRRRTIDTSQCGMRTTMLLVEDAA